MRISSLFVGLMLCLVLLCTGGPSRAQSEKITMVVATSFAELEPKKNLGGIAELAALLKGVRKKNPGAIVLHGGAVLGPSTLSSFDRGAHMIDLLNRMELTAMAIAKSEFSHGEDELTLRANEAAFPMLCSNLYDPLSGGNLEGLESDIIIDAGPYKLGVLAIVDREVEVDYLPKRVKTTDSVEAINRTSTALRGQGADLVVLMVDDRFAVETRNLLAEGLADIVVQFVNHNQVVPTRSGLLVQLDNNDGGCAILELSLSGQGESFQWNNNSRIVYLNQYPKDPEFQELVTGYQNQLSQILDKPIGKSSTPLDTTRPAVRLAENAFGNLVADALREYHQSDIALINGGGIRGDRRYPAGVELTGRDIHSELPFRNRTILISVKGAQIVTALENGFSRLKDMKGRYPQVSGMTVKYAPTAPAGERVRSVLINGKPLDPHETYTMSTLDYLANGGDGYTVFKNNKRLSTMASNQLILDCVKNYITKKKVIAPAIEGRLVAVSE